MKTKPVLNPQNPQLRKAVSLQQQGKLTEAVAIYKSLLASYPEDAALLNTLAQLCLQIGLAEDSLDCCRKSLEINSAQATIWFYLGTACKFLQRYDEALRGFDQAIQLQQNFAEAFCNRGSVYQDLRQYEAALANFNQAIELRRHYAIAFNNRGIALRNLTRFSDAIDSFDQAIALNPNFAEAYCYRGLALMDLGETNAAIQCYARALAIRPNFVDALYNIGQAYYQLREYQTALENFMRAAELKSDIDFIQGQILITRLQICDWQNLQSNIQTMESKILRGEAAVNPFVAHAFSDDPALQRQASETWSRLKYPAVTSNTQYAYPKHQRIRIAYFSSDFHSHPMAFLAAELFERHDRNQFEIFGFCNTSCAESDTMRIRLKKGFDHFIDIRKRSNTEAVQLAQELEIDIAVDLGGHTRGSRTGVFAMRAAPVQISYLGFLGTLGSPYMDYLFTDQVLIPEASRQYYTEKLVYLPCYQVNDSQRLIADKQFTRAELGLPDSGFVFCCFNNSFKLNPLMFACWMRILQAVPDSVLFLYADNATAEINLRQTAQQYGVAPKQLVFATRVPTPAYLARYRVADLFLDTLPYNAGATASDALWAGLPVLTCMGASFAGRMAASLLTAIELPELITQSLPEYESLAIELATDAAKMAKIKAKLAENRLTTALFNTALSTRNIETAYRQMYENHKAGLTPTHIFI